VRFSDRTTEREAYLANGSVPPEPISHDIFHHAPGDPFEAPDRDRLDMQLADKP
jgi:hypothetical protein